jgi:hypothetical protein
MTICPTCNAHYKGSHTCPPWMVQMPELDNVEPLVQDKKYWEMIEDMKSLIKQAAEIPKALIARDTNGGGLWLHIEHAFSDIDTQAVAWPIQEDEVLPIMLACQKWLEEE